MRFLIEGLCRCHLNPSEDFYMGMLLFTVGTLNLLNFKDAVH